MRVAVFFGFVLALALAGYLAVSAYFLAKAASGLMTVGPLAQAIAAAEPTSDPLSLGFRGPPDRALGLAYQTVAIETPLGPGEAWLVPAAGREQGRAIYVHGIAGAREDGYRHLSMLHEAGWTVLLITYRNDRGAPVSPDRRYGFGLTEWPDLEAAVAYLAPGPDDPRLLVVAESMGAAVLGQFLRQSPLADRVGAIALDSPALEFRAVLDHLAAQTGRPLSGVIGAAAAALAPRLTGLPLGEASVTATYAAFPGPLFVAHGSGDRIVPIGPAQALAAARATTEVLWTEADHLGSFAADPAAYRSAFTRFLASLPAL
jgi:hypothetical protein